MQTDLVEVYLPEPEQTIPTLVESQEDKPLAQPEASEHSLQPAPVQDETSISNADLTAAADQAELEALKTKLASRGKLKSKDRKRLEELTGNAER
ncbi:hypothetical protein Micbo1qcDRAFT_157523, partial [Microdochium bolleyi]